jgi:hypothetical protein
VKNYNYIGDLRLKSTVLSIFEFGFVGNNGIFEKDRK